MISGTEFLEALLRASLVLLLSGLVLTAVLRLVKPRAVWLHRTAWLSVLMSGVMLAPFTITLPWLKSNSSTEWRTSRHINMRLTPGQNLVVLDKKPVDVRSPHEENRKTARAAPARPNELQQLQPKSNDAVFLTEIVDWGIGIWVAGIVFLAGFGVVSWVLLMRILRHCPVAAQDYQQEADEVAASLRLKGSPRLIVHESLGPMLCLTRQGYRVVVPEDTWPELSADQRKAILRHELAHRQRHDVVKSLAVRLLALLHWFNPLAWWAARRFDEAAEWACDATLSRQPDQVAALASALLEFVERRKRGRHIVVGVSAVQGASVCTRLRRLLDDTHSRIKEPIMKRLFVLIVVALVFAAGALQFQLVAKPSRDRSEPRHGELHDLESWKHQASVLADQLDTNNNRLAEEFRAVLSTDPGLVVLQDRAGRRSDEAREDAQANVFADMLAAHFDEVGNEYQLRDGEQDYRESVLRNSDQVNRSIESMRRLFHEHAERFTASSENEQMFLKFIQSDVAPVMVYMETVHDQIQPNVDTILEETGGFFVRQADGSISIHPARREDAEARLKQLSRVEQASRFVAEELEDWLAELTESDDLHRIVRETMQHPHFATMIVAWSLEETSEKAEFNHRLEIFFEQLEEFTSDTAKGLVFSDEAREEVQHHMQEFRRMLKSAETLREPVAELAEQFSQQDELNKGWRALLATDAIRLRLATKFRGAGLEPEAIVRGFISEVLEESDDGTLRLRNEEQEELLEHVRDLFREFRKFRRRARIVNQQTSRISDSELREAFTTWGGRLVMKIEVEQRLRRLSSDGFALWLDEHFVDNNGRLTLRPKAEESISDFLADVEAVKRELDNDDFQHSDDRSADTGDTKSDR